MFDRCIYFNLSTLNRQITKIWQDEFARYGLAPSHAYLLAALHATPDASQKDLAELMELDASTITRFIDVLASKALITRSGRGKGTTYGLTPRGRALVDEVDESMSRLFGSMKDLFGEDHFHSFVGSLHAARSLVSDQVSDEVCHLASKNIPDA